VCGGGGLSFERDLKGDIIEVRGKGFFEIVDQLPSVQIEGESWWLVRKNMLLMCEYENATQFIAEAGEQNFDSAGDRYEITVYLMKPAAADPGNKFTVIVPEVD
jgi:hypothetical protein